MTTLITAAREGDPSLAFGLRDVTDACHVLKSISHLTLTFFFQANLVLFLEENRKLFSSILSVGRPHVILPCVLLAITSRNKKKNLKRNRNSSIATNLKDCPRKAQ